MKIELISARKPPPPDCLSQAFGFLPCLIAIGVLSIVYAISAIVICVDNCGGWFGYATVWAIMVGITSAIACITVTILLMVAPRVVR